MERARRIGQAGIQLESHGLPVRIIQRQLGIQALVILGGTLRLIPLTGITLPFVSYGGSSLLVNTLMVGLLLAVSAERRGAPGG